MTTFGPALLPLEAKLQLCRELLAEFGADRILERRGAHELRVRCVLPDHEDRKPSADLNYDKLVYSCLSCGSAGGLLWLIGTCRHSTERQAREWLERQSGQGPDLDMGMLFKTLAAIVAGPQRDRTPIPRMSPNALKPWRYIHDYLTEDRGIPEANVRRLEIGYAARYPIREDDGEGGKVERYSERVVFPHWWTLKTKDGPQRCLVGWQSRRLYDDGTPKYLSTAEFPRDKTIYNYDPDRRVAVVVESPMTVARHVHHLPIEATFGATVTETQVRLLARHQRVIIWMDNDTAGWRATAGWREGKVWHPGLIERLTPYCEVWVVNSNWAADGAQMDEEMARELIEGSTLGPLWRKPERLRCWKCTEYHTGRCEPAEAA